MENIAAGKSKPAVILKALVVSYIVTALLLLLLALLLFKFELNESKVSIGVIVVYLLSSFIGGMARGQGRWQQKVSVGSVDRCNLFCVASFDFHDRGSRDPDPGSTDGYHGSAMRRGRMLGGMLS